MNDRDLLILKYLAQGLQVKEIPIFLQKENNINISPSTIEKRLSFMRKQLGAKTLFQLGAVLKAKRII